MHDTRDPSLLQDLRALPRPFWVLFAGTLVNRFGTFVLPFLTIFLTRSGYSLGQVSLAISAHGAGSLVASVFGGYFADRIGRRNTIIAGTFTNAAFVFALYFAHSLPAIVALAVFAGFTGGFYPPASSALLADLVPPERSMIDSVYAPREILASRSLRPSLGSSPHLILLAVRRQRIHSIARHYQFLFGANPAL